MFHTEEEFALYVYQLSPLGKIPLPLAIRYRSGGQSFLIFCQTLTPRLKERVWSTNVKGLTRSDSLISLLSYSSLVSLVSARSWLFPLRYNVDYPERSAPLLSAFIQLHHSASCNRPLLGSTSGFLARLHRWLVDRSSGSKYLDSRRRPVLLLVFGQV